MTIRVLIADDYSIVRAGLRSLLRGRPEIEVVGEAAEGARVIPLVDRLGPDVLLLDVSMPDADGIEIARTLGETCRPVRVLILTAHEDPQLMRAALAAGAAGYIVKRAGEEELVDAITAVMRGDVYIHPSMTRALMQEYVPEPAEQETAESILTSREREVLELIAQGYTNGQIASKLFLSVCTVDTHRSHIMSKLGLHRRTQLVEYAVAQGILNRR